MGMETMTRPAIGEWYTSTVDGRTRGEVVAVADNYVTVRVPGWYEEEEYAGEDFADMWQ